MPAPGSSLPSANCPAAVAPPWVPCGEHILISQDAGQQTPLRSIPPTTSSALHSFWWRHMSHPCAAWPLPLSPYCGHAYLSTYNGHFLKITSVSNSSLLTTVPSKFMDSVVWIKKGQIGKTWYTLEDKRQRVRSGGTVILLSICLVTGLGIYSGCLLNVPQWSGR